MEMNGLNISYSWKVTLRVIKFSYSTVKLDIVVNIFCCHCNVLTEQQSVPLLYRFTSTSLRAPLKFGSYGGSVMRIRESCVFKSS